MKHFKFVNWWFRFLMSRTGYQLFKSLYFGSLCLHCYGCVQLRPAFVQKTMSLAQKALKEWRRFVHFHPGRSILNLCCACKICFPAGSARLQSHDFLRLQLRLVYFRVRSLPKVFFSCRMSGSYHLDGASNVEIGVAMSNICYCYLF